jgi:hypothetical protein
LTRPGHEGDSERIAPDDATLVVPQTDAEGFYRVEAGGEGSGVRLGFSVNLPAESTELARVDRALLDKLFGDFKFQLARGRVQIDRAVTNNRIGSEWFPYLMYALLAVLALEHLMANRYYRAAPE